MNIRGDWELRARMSLVMLVLLVFYALFTGVVALAIESLIIALVVMGILIGLQLWLSDSLALRSMKAEPADPEDYPELHAIVQRTSQQADIPKPNVTVSPFSTPNAFAVGIRQKSATITVTKGLLRTLDEDELEAVIAHEVSHIKNRDVLVMTIASFFTTLTFTVVRWGFLADTDDARATLIALLISLIMGIVSWFMVRALSRYREYAADRGAAIITGKPAALASALSSIDETANAIPEEDLREAKNGPSALFFFTNDEFGSLFSTHPPAEERVERLRDLQTELNQ